jgi:hypothetical protein
MAPILTPRGIRMTIPRNRPAGRRFAAPEDRDAMG